MNTTCHFARLLCFFTLGLALLLCGCSRSAKRDRYLTRGQAFFKAEQYDKAEIEFLNVLRLERTNAVAAAHLGLSYYQQGRTARAFVFLQKAAELQPTNAEVRLRLAGILLASRKVREARGHADAILANDPANEEALMLLADAVTSMKDAEDTAHRIQSLQAQLGNKVGFYVALGTLNLRQQRTNEALVHFQQSLSLDPRSSPAHLAIGNLFSFLRDTAQADLHFKQAAELAPPRSPRRIQYVDFKLRQGDTTAARALLETMIKEAPDYIPSYTRLAEIAFTGRQFDEAAALARKTLDRDPGNYEAMLLLGRVNLAKREVPKALADFERLAAAYPRAPQAHFQLALAQLMSRNSTKAISSLQQAISIDPKHTESILMLAELNIRHDQIDPAISALKAVVKEQPDLGQAHILLASAYRAQRNLDAAAAVYENMTRTLPPSPQPYFLWGQILLLQQKKDDARAKFEKANEISPNFLLSLDELVDLDIADNQFSAIKDRIQRYIDQHPRSPALYVMLAKIRAAEKDYPAAEAALSRVIELDPNYQPAYFALARVYLAANKHQHALDRVKAVLAKSTNDVAAFMLSGMIQSQMKNYDAAREAYEKLLEVDPHFAPALNNLAYLYSEHLNLPDKAFEHARLARDAAPSDPIAADTLGWILFKRGEYAWALNLLQESAEKLPKSAEILYHLGMTHYMLGDEQPARVALERALAGGQDFAGKAQAKEKLDLLSGSFGESNDIVTIERQLKANPGDPILLARLASFHENAGAADKAVAAYDQVLRLNPKNISAMLRLANLYAGPLRQPQKAMEVAKQARTIAPEDPHVTYVLGRLAFQAADHQWSVSLLQESARKFSGDPQLLYDLAWAWYSVGQVASADSTMKKAVASSKAFPKSAEAKRFLEAISVHLQPDKAQAAAPQITAILKEDPAYVPALFASAILLEQSGNATAACNLYTEVLKTFPSFFPAHKRLAILLSPADAKVAYEHASKARQALPDDLEVSRTLGILTFHRQEYSRAVQLLTETLRKRPDDAELLYYLGSAYVRLENKAQARLMLQRALTVNSNASFAPDAKRLLAQIQDSRSGAATGK